MGKRSWQIIAVVFLIVSGTGLVVLAFTLRDFDWEILRKTTPKYLGIIFFLSALSTALYTLEVYTFLRGSGFRASIWRIYLILTSSMSVNYVTPLKVGIPIRIYLYRRFIQIPVSIGTALVATETLVGMIVPAIFAMAGIIILFPEIGLSAPILLLVVLLSGTGLILRVKPERVTQLLARFLPSRFRQRITEFVSNVQVGFRSVSKWTLTGVTCILLLNLAVTSARLYFIVHMLGYAVDPMSVFYVRVISVTVSSASMIPMGLGVRDASVALLLVKLGLSSGIALSSALVERLLSPGWPLLLGIISANILGPLEMLRVPGCPSETEKEAPNERAT